MKEVVTRDVEETSGGRIQALEGGISEQKQFVETKIADIFEAIRLLQTNHIPTNASKSGERINTDASQRFNDMQYNDLNRQNRHQSHPTYSGMTRMARVDFPRFNGENVKEWLFKVKEFFAIDTTPMEIRVRLASIHFDQMAAAWHQSIAQSEQDAYVIENWEQYKVLLKERFEEVLDDPIAELKKLQETGDISHYHA